MKPRRAKDQLKVPEDEARLCDPSQVVDLVHRKEIDLLAPAIGTAHGVYNTKNPKLDFDRLQATAGMLKGNGPKTPLVIHGGSGLADDVVKHRLAGLCRQSLAKQRIEKEPSLEAWRGYEMVTADTARCVLLINPELPPPQVNYCDRDSHFIFGEVATAAILERADTDTRTPPPHAYEIIHTKRLLGRESIFEKALAGGDKPRHYTPGSC